MLVLLDLVINTAILCATYPIWRELKYQNHPPAFWIWIYGWAAVFATVIVVSAGIAAFVIVRSKSLKRKILLQIAITFCLLAGFAIFADFSEPYPAANWPVLIQEISAKFFSELQSIWFTAVSATSMSIIAGFLAVPLGKKGTA